MLGYITPDKPELKMKEYDLYSAYYCGICKAIKKRHGEIQRLVLSYDSVLLAMILAAVEAGQGDSATEPGGNGATVKLERCMIHPIKKRAIVYNEAAVDYAADMLVILAYYKFEDDWKDERKAVGGMGMLAFRQVRRKITSMYPDTCDIINKSINQLAELEKKNCQSLDEAAEPFAQLMKAVFSGSQLTKDVETQGLLGIVGYNIGKWVYLIDAVDDLEQDVEKNRFNPLKGIRGDDNYKSRMEFSLLCVLENASLALKNLKLEKNKGIIENIIYFGLLKKTEELLGLVHVDSNHENEIT